MLLRNLACKHLGSVTQYARGARQSPTKSQRKQPGRRYQWFLAGNGL